MVGEVTCSSGATWGSECGSRTLQYEPGTKTPALRLMDHLLYLLSHSQRLWQGMGGVYKHIYDHIDCIICSVNEAEQKVSSGQFLPLFSVSFFQKCVFSTVLHGSRFGWLLSGVPAFLAFSSRHSLIICVSFRQEKEAVWCIQNES